MVWSLLWLHKPTQVFFTHTHIYIYIYIYIYIVSNLYWNLDLYFFCNSNVLVACDVENNVNGNQTTQSWTYSIQAGQQQQQQQQKC